MDLKTLSPTEQLDFVLNYIRKQSGPRERNIKRFHEFCKEITNNEFPDQQAIRSILDRLKEDKYIEEGVRNLDPGAAYHMFAITFDGEALLDVDGGYSGRKATQDRNISLGKRNERYLRLGAVWAAIFAGGYLIWDILKYLFEHYPQFPCWKCIEQLFF